MGVYTTWYQMKQEHFVEFTNLINRVKSRRNRLTNSELNQIYNRMDEITVKNSISSIYYKSIKEDNIQILVTRDAESPYNYDPKNIAQLPFYGNGEYGFSLIEGSEGILQETDIDRIVKYLKSLEIDSKEKFDSYFSKLSDEFKSEMFIEPSKNETEEEYLYSDLKPFLEFYYECQRNNSWIYIYCS